MMTVPVAVGDLVTIGARRHPHRVALRDRSGRERTYAELDERTTRLANSLLGVGLAPGDRVSAWMGDVFEHVEVYLAAAKAGLVVAPINARLAAPEAAHQIEDAGSRLLVWTSDLDSRVSQMDQLGVIDGLVRVCVGVSLAAAAEDYEVFLSKGSSMPPDSEVDPSGVLILGYTSGTTGRPKGAMLTHRGVVAIAAQNARSFRLAAYPEWILTGSMSFVSVMPSHVMSAFRIGGTVTIMGRWDADDLVDAVRRNRGTFAYVPSPLLHDVTAAISRDPSTLDSVTSVLHSASRADPEHLAALHDVIGTRLVEGWGMTEHSGGLATATTESDYFVARRGARIFGSVGRSVVDAEVRVVDDRGDRLPHDGQSIGELIVKSPALMKGYWRRPDATAEVLRDGWYHTGDLGCITEEGYVSISERRTDLIVSGGANVYPSEVERCIGELSEVREVAVVGAPHPRWGQSVVAVVVLTHAGALSESAVIDHCRRQMAGFKKPSRVLFVDDLPRTTSLKVARGELREVVAQLIAAEGFEPS